MPRLPYPISRGVIRRGVVVLGLAAATLSCGTKAPAITGVTVAVTFSGVDVDQLEVSITTPLGEALAERRTPDPTRGPLASPQSVSVYLPDALADQVATCTVRGLLAGEVTATGSGTGTLVLNRLVPVPVELTAGAGDGSAPTDGETTDAADGSIDAAAGDGGAPDLPVTTDAGLKINGQPCAKADECDSTLCVDGVCCASACMGLCEACNVAGKLGTCSPELAGTPAPPTTCAKQPQSTCGFDGTCDGNGGCRRYPAGIGCKAEACVGSVYTPPGACDGQGMCMVLANIDCTPYVCDATSSPPACRETCRAGGTDCKAPAVCSNNSCGAKPKQADGAGCVDGTDCASTHCVDGVCCATACTTACNSCNQTGNEGKCVPVAAGKVDPRGVCKDQGATGCGRNGLCDAAGACQLYPATTVCAAASCSARFVRQARHCDGKGACAAAPADMDCQPYRCDPMTAACFKTCTDNAQCANAPKKTCNTTTMMCQ